MDYKNYRERKQAKKTEFRKLGEKTVVVFLQNYDSGTGKRLDDTVSQLNVHGLKNDLKNLQEQIAQAQEYEKDLIELIADVEAETAKTDAATTSNTKAK